MKQVIKYAALIFALVLSASIIGGCLMAGVAIIQNIRDEVEYPEDMKNGNNDLWYRTEEGDVMFLGIHFAGDRKVKSGSEQFAASEIDSMDIEVGSCELIIETFDGDTVLVEYEYIPEHYEIFVDEKTLIVEKDDIVVFWGNSFTETPKIRICVPNDKEFKKVDVDKGSGSAKVLGLLTYDFNMDNGSGGVGIADVTAKNLSVDSSSGGINLSDTTAEKSVFHSGSGSFIVQNCVLGETSMDAGSGFVNFEHVVAKNLVLDTGSGRVDVSGILTGNSVFDSGSGSVNVVVYGEEQEYNIRTDMGSGSFYLNGKKENDNHIEHSGADNLLIFSAGSGRVSVEFKSVPANMPEEAVPFVPDNGAETTENTATSGESYER